MTDFKQIFESHYTWIEGYMRNVRRYADRIAMIASETGKEWTYKQLNLIGQVFKIENLYHFIDLEFKHVGPEGADNYLLIFDIVSRKEFVKNLKRMLIHGLIYVIIAIIVLFIIL